MMSVGQQTNKPIELKKREEKQSQMKCSCINFSVNLLVFVVIVVVVSFVLNSEIEPTLNWFTLFRFTKIKLSPLNGFV